MISRSVSEELKQAIRTVPDFPRPGIMFRDVTTLLARPRELRLAVDALHEHFKNREIRKVAGIEARGFIFGAPLAYLLGVGFVPLRKAGKLPAPVYRETYSLEYGTDTVEMHRDAVVPGEKVLIVDDLLATGGTARAARRLVEQAGGEVAALAFLVDLSLPGSRENFGDLELLSLVTYAVDAS